MLRLLIGLLLFALVVYAASAMMFGSAFML